VQEPQPLGRHLPDSVPTSELSHFNSFLHAAGA